MSRQTREYYRDVDLFGGLAENELSDESSDDGWETVPRKHIREPDVKDDGKYEKYSKNAKLPNFFGVKGEVKENIPLNRNYCIDDNCLPDESMKCGESDNHKKKAFECCSNIVSKLPTLALLMDDGRELVTRGALSVRILFLLEYIEMATRLPLNSMHKFTKIPEPDPNNKNYRPLWSPPSDHKLVNGKITPEIHTLTDDQWKLFFKLFTIQLVYLHNDLNDRVPFVSLPLHPDFVDTDAMADAHKSDLRRITENNKKLWPKQWPHITVLGDGGYLYDEDPLDTIYMCYSWIFMLVKSGCLVMDENNFPVLEFRGVRTDSSRFITYVKSVNTTGNNNCFSDYHKNFASDVGRKTWKKLHVSYGTTSKVSETKVVPKNNRIYVLPFLMSVHGIVSPIFEICSGRVPEEIIKSRDAAMKEAQGRLERRKRQNTRKKENQDSRYISTNKDYRSGDNFTKDSRYSSTNKDYRSGDKDIRDSRYSSTNNPNKNYYVKENKYGALK